MDRVVFDFGCRVIVFIALLVLPFVCRAGLGGDSTAQADTGACEEWCRARHIVLVSACIAREAACGKM